MPDALTVQTRPAAVLRVSGEDAPAYLQSQCSKDLRGLGPGQVRYGLWLDRKGKVHADSLIFCQEPEVFILLSPYCPAEALTAKLEENIIADEVEIEDLTVAARTVVEIGLPAGDMPAAGIFSMKQAGEGSVSADGLSFAGRRSVRPCRETLWLYGLPEGADALPSDDDALACERITAGIAAVPADIGPGDLPQEGGLERDAVSFNKGCYLGQEVMARLHAMGRTQRALHRVTLDKLPASLPAEVLDAEGKTVGELRSAAACADGVVGLAMLKKRALGEGNTFTLTGGGQVAIGEALV
jgi:folate-binding protein YgfZ